MSVEEAYGELKDPRSQASSYGLTEMLLVALCAILRGAEGWAGIQTRGEQKIDWWRQHVPLPHGIPSHDTFGRVFAAPDPACFEARFIRGMSGLIQG